MKRPRPFCSTKFWQADRVTDIAGPDESAGVLVAVIVVAAGSGTRLGRPEPKAFVEVAGRSILARSLDTVFMLAKPAQVIVVAPVAMLDRATEIAEDVAGPVRSALTVVAGGDTRQQSVSAGLAVLDDSVGVVLVHDAARAFTPIAQFERVIATVHELRAGVVPGLPVADTIKQVDWTGAVQRTVDRSELVAVQTPQGFPRAELVAAYAAATEDHTDDAALFASAGHAVITVEGDAEAFKITTPWDLRRAEGLAAGSMPTAGSRVGIGIDVHAFDEARPLWLGGLYWPAEPGLAGHSDGDAVCHAICDALLSAAGLGDIGARFGTADSRFVEAHGDVFIAETLDLVRGAGYAVGNVSVQVVSNRPKVAPRRLEVEARLTELVGAPVSVSATTTDGLGFTGRGEGITAIATALLR
jgi:2-C-methyl-D-erythritol 4-phosphate cytidylyltransferase / 2-C-methyl-D-erythritol 2,4-cyclodiphosphate synthase